jgi:hypothetical protein
VPVERAHYAACYDVIVASLYDAMCECCMASVILFQY